MISILVAWLAAALVLALAAVFLGIAIGSGALGILIDNRGRYSLTQLQLVLWTVVVISLISGVAMARIASAAAGGPLGFTIPDELLVVMGISVTSTVLAITAKAARDADHPEGIAASNKDDRPRPSQIFLLEEGELADKTVDVIKFQNFFITIVLIILYVASAVLAVRGLGAVAELKALPGFPATFLTLLGISHGGYLAGKLPKRPGSPEGLTLAAKRLGALPGSGGATRPPTTYVPRNPQSKA